MLLSLQRVQAPTVEPVSLDQLKQQCVLDSSFTDDDALLTMYGVAAREYAENYTRRAFLPQQWQLNLDHFPTYTYTGIINPSQRRDWPAYAGVWQGMTIALPKPTCISVDSITYFDAAGAPQTVDPSTYKVDLNSKPARVVPKSGLYWPLNTIYIPGSIAVNYTSGSYATADEVPRSIRLAILLLASHWYQNRMSVSTVNLSEIPFGVKALLDMYRVTVLDYQEVV